MKKFYLTLVISIALMTANPLQAQSSDEFVKRGMTNYLAALQKGNEGLTESAIFKLMKMKVDYPNMDYSECIKELDKVSETNPNKTTRMKAYLASKYIQNPEHFYWIEDSNYKEVTRFFDKVRTGLDDQNVLVDAE